LPITKERKDELVASYVDLLQKADGFIIIQFGGMGVTEIDQLRAAIRKVDGKYVVAKNTLLTKALEQAGWPVPEKHLQGPTAVAFGLTNFPGVAKAVLDFVKDKEKVGVKGGVMGRDILNATDVEAVSNLPSLDELRSMIAGLVVAPAQGVVNVIYAATGGIVNVLQALEDKHNAPAEGAAAEGAA
jgi:large subunit ribosomal protein L10